MFVNKFFGSAFRDPSKLTKRTPLSWDHPPPPPIFKIQDLSELGPLRIGKIGPLRIGKIQEPSELGPSRLAKRTIHNWQNRTPRNWNRSDLANQDPSELGPLRVGKKQDPSRLAKGDPSGLAKTGLLRIGTSPDCHNPGPSELGSLRIGKKDPSILAKYRNPPNWDPPDWQKRTPPIWLNSTPPKWTHPIGQKTGPSRLANCDSSGLAKTGPLQIGTPPEC